VETWDVVIAGGGSAGIAAGVLAARSGAKTLLLERQGVLGGMATTALVHSVCGLYRIREEPGAEYANPGFVREFAERLISSGASSGPERMGKLDVLPCHPTGFALVADEVVRAEPNLTVWLHTDLTEVTQEADGISISWNCRGERGQFQAKTLIDASGDGSAVAMAGLPTELTSGRKLQRPAYIFGLTGGSTEAFGEESRFQIAHAIVQGVRDGKLSAPAMGAQFRAVGREGEGFCTLDLSGSKEGKEPVTYNPLDPECLTEIEQLGRATALELVDFLRQALPELRSCRISHFPTRAGIRESRRVVTAHMLTQDEFLAAEPFPDRIAYSAWLMELRETNRGPRWTYYSGDEPPQIPLRSLQVKGSDRFFVAGRCIGADHATQAAIRVMGTCMATGQAAGVAAALRAGDNAVDAPTISKALEW